MLVQNGLLRELYGHGLIKFEGQQTAGINPLCRNDVQSPCTFRTLYDFSRTAGSVLRMFMLEASGMKVFYDPEFGSRPQNFHTDCVLSPMVPLFAPHSSMAHGDYITACRRARRLASEFDRLFPHCVIEYELYLIPAGGTKTVSGHMYVIYFDEGIIYQIDATMDVHILNLSPGHKEIHANVHVQVSKYVFMSPIITAENQHEYSRFVLVKQLVNEWMPSQTPTPNDGVTALMQDLRM